MAEEKGQQPEQSTSDKSGLEPPKPPAPSAEDIKKHSKKMAQQVQETKQFEAAKQMYAEKLGKLFEKMKRDGIGVVPTITLTITPVGGTVVARPLGTNYTLVRTPKPEPEKKDKKAKKKARKDKKKSQKKNK